VALTNLRMVVKPVADRGGDEAIPRNTVLVGAFPAAVMFTISIRYDGFVPPHQHVEALIETPSGSIAVKSSGYTSKQRTNHGEVTISTTLTAREAGVYTVRATLDNRDVPPQKIAIRQSEAR
jgi:hypothetical protein